jgi:uncharacterized protein with HXXEE motif
VRWHYRDPELLWLFVPAYGVHLVEEWFAGFPTWVASVFGRPLPTAAFFTINAVAMVLALVGIRAAVRTERYGWIGIAIATVFLINAMSHLAGSLLTGSYSPGLFTAVALYVPLASLTMIRAVDQAPRGQLLHGAIAGALVHAAVFIVAYAATNIS